MFTGLLNIFLWVIQMELVSIQIEQQYFKSHAADIQTISFLFWCSLKKRRSETTRVRHKLVRPNPLQAFLFLSMIVCLLVGRSAFPLRQLKSQFTDPLPPRSYTRQLAHEALYRRTITLTPTHTKAPDHSTLIFSNPLSLALIDYLTSYAV